MREAKFFPEASTNYARNLLLGQGRGEHSDDAVAIRFVREDNVRRSLSWRELRDQAAAFASFLRSSGVEPGDRVAAWLPNTPEVIVAMLATSMIGAVFTSTSPDFGVAGVLDRFGQVEPTVLIGTDGYVYAGKSQPRLTRLAEVASQLPTLAAVVVVEELEGAPDVSEVPKATTWRAALDAHSDATAEFVDFGLRCTWLHPLQLGHYWGSQVHRSPRRGVAPEARGRTSAPLRHSSRRCCLLLHDLRLDDVELAGVCTCHGSLTRPLRRIPFSPHTKSSVGFGRRVWHHFVRNVSKVPRCIAQDGSKPRTNASIGDAADHHVYRLTTRSGGVRVRVPRRQERRALSLHFWRNRHLWLLCRWGPNPPSLCRRDSGTGFRNGG